MNHFWGLEKRWILERLTQKKTKKKSPPHVLINPAETFLKAQDDEKQFLAPADDPNLSSRRVLRLRPLNQDRLRES